jgi:pantothenate kinase
MTPSALATQITSIPFEGRRRLVAVAGPPASGKSTLAEDLATQDPAFRVVPMDGFHLDNVVLEARGLLARKGSPQTFDAAGFVHLIRRLRTEDEVVIPAFDRALDKSINGAAVVGPDVTTVIVEGNYLLLDAPVWRELAALWDYSIQLDVPEDVLRARLMQRWLSYGFSEADALSKAEANDLPNAAFVRAHSLNADLRIASS